MPEIEAYYFCNVLRRQHDVKPWWHSALVNSLKILGPIILFLSWLTENNNQKDIDGKMQVIVNNESIIHMLMGQRNTNESAYLILSMLCKKDTAFYGPYKHKLVEFCENTITLNDIQLQARLLDSNWTVADRDTARAKLAPDTTLLYCMRDTGTLKQFVDMTHQRFHNEAGERIVQLVREINDDKLYLAQASDDFHNMANNYYFEGSLIFGLGFLIELIFKSVYRSQLIKQNNKRHKPDY